MERLNDYKNRVRILCIEDEELAANKIVKILSKTYKEIILAKNGEEALDIYKNSYLENNPIDIVISDINMPKMNGIEFLERVREFDDSLPFIYVSANLNLETLLQLVKLDIINFIQKPVDIEELIKSVDKVILNKYKTLFFKNNHLDKKVNVGEKLSWDMDTKTLFENDEILKLTKNEILLIELLVKNQNSVVTTENIINYIWEESTNNSTIANLKNLISRLRIKIPRLNMENIYGLGYKIKVINGQL